MSFQLLTVLVASAGLAMVGLTYNSLAAYFMFSTLVALLLVSYVCSRLPKRVLEFRREVADRVFEREPFPVVLELTNKGRVPLFLLRVCDSLPPYLTPEERDIRVGANILQDSTWPAHWRPEEIPQKVTFENSYPDKTREWVIQNWKKLGYGEEPLLKK